MEENRSYNEKFELQKKADAFYKLLRDRLTTDISEVRHIWYYENEKVLLITSKSLPNFNALIRDQEPLLALRSILINLVKEDSKYLDDLKKVREEICINEESVEDTYTFLLEVNKFISREMERFISELNGV